MPVLKFLLLFLSAVLITGQSAVAQSKANPHTDTLNMLRIKTNETGMKVLGTWAAANVITGIPGYFIANDKEWKNFHGMNAIWGVVNLGISGMGFMAARKESGTEYNATDALHRYEASKRLFLINAGLDVTYIASGALLLSYADRQTDAATCRGFGRSVVLQGVFLLLFDGTMYSLHQHQDSRWYRAMQHICISSNGIGLRYSIQ